MNNQTRSIVSILTLVLAAFVVRLVGINSSGLWLDEYTSIEIATKPIADILNGTGFDRHTPPLYYILLHGWFALFSPGEVTLRLFSVLFDLFNVVLLARLVGREFGERIGASVATLYAISGYAIYYAQEGRMYSLLLFFSLCMFDRVLRISRGEQTWSNVVVLGLVSAAGLYTHYYAGLFLAALGCAMFLTHIREWQKIKLFGAGMLLAAILYLPFVQTIVRLAGSGGQSFRRFTLEVIPVTLLRFSAGYGIAPLNAPIRYDTGAFLLKNLPEIAAYLILFGALCVLGIIGLLRNNNIRKWFWICPLVLPPLLALILSIKVPLYSERYLIVSFPFYLIAVVMGVESFANKTHRMVRGSVVLLLGLQLFAQMLSPQFGKEQWREVAEYLKVNGNPARDSIIVSPNHCTPVLNYYLNDRFRFSRPDASKDFARVWYVRRGLEVFDRPLDLQVERTQLFPKESGIYVEELLTRGEIKN